MLQVETLLHSMVRLEGKLAACSRCGMCQAVCPLYLHTGREPDVARGKLALLDGLAAEMFKHPRGVLARLDRCLMCGKCEAHCPRGVKTLEIFLEARAILNGFLGLSPAKRMLLRKILTHPDRLDRLAGWGARLQKVLTRPASAVAGTCRFRWPAPSGRHMPPLAPKSFGSQTPAMDLAPRRAGIRAAFFTGCAIDKIFPRVGQAALAALSCHGAGIFLPAGQGCCGLPALAAGDMDSFQRLVAANLRLFDPDQFDVLVTACGSCAMTLKKLWPLMAGDQGLAHRIQLLAAKTVDIHQFIVDRFGPDIGAKADEPAAVRVTYHDPCHLRGSLGISEAPRTLIRANPAARLAEMTAAGDCCGMGGSFSLTHYPLSLAIGQRKLAHIAATGCQVVATGCPACMIQLSDLISRSGMDIQVRHAIEIYAESLGAVFR